LNYLKKFDPFGESLCTCKVKYTINPYTGCNHRCRYCYITSYIKDGFRLRVKKDFLKEIEKEIKKIEKNYPVNLSSSSDPYPLIEKELEFTRKTLEFLKKENVKVSIITKSPLVLRDIDLLKDMDSYVSVTITHFDDSIAKKVEPYAPPPSKRIEAAKILIRENIRVCIRIDPVIPGYNDSAEIIEKILQNIGNPFMITLSTYKAKPDNFKRMMEIFPHIRNLPWERKGIRGYRYLEKNLREKILSKLIKVAKNYSSKIGLCREGLDNLKNTISCDPVFE